MKKIPNHLRTLQLFPSVKDAGDSLIGVSVAHEDDDGIIHYEPIRIVTSENEYNFIPIIEVIMSYQLTPEQLDLISDIDLVFGTKQLLPHWEQIPNEFKEGNIYTKLATAIFYKMPLPEGNIEFRNGFDEIKLINCIRAHLASFEPKHEHKIAGVGYIIYSAAIITNYDNN